MTVGVCLTGALVPRYALEVEDWFLFPVEGSPIETGHSAVVRSQRYELFVLSQLPSKKILEKRP